MKRLVTLGLVVLTHFALAHDEGHGPKLTDTPQQGGKVAPVVAASDAAKGPKAEMIYKSELVRTESGVVKVYLYDKQMKLLAEPQLAQFGKAAMATVEHIKKGKIARTSKFSLELKGGVFEGTMGEIPQTQTFNVDVKMMGGSQELLAAFDGLETKIQ